MLNKSCIKNRPFQGGFFMEENRKENRKSCSYQNGGFVELSGNGRKWIDY